MSKVCMSSLELHRLFHELACHGWHRFIAHINFPLLGWVLFESISSANHDVCLEKEVSVCYNCKPVAIS
eukprot:scaffold337722_cov43-Prasinocladus_malaysianus.AAC.1